MSNKDLLRTLAAASRTARSTAQQRLAGHGLHAGQDHLLEQLWEQDGLTVGVIADRMGVEVPTVVRMVRRLEAAGVVRRAPDKADKRRSYVVLTKRGRALKPLVRDYLGAIARSATRGLSDAEKRQLIRMLEHVTSNLRASGSAPSKEKAG